MPHKRAKRTVRDEIKEKRGTDLAPGKDSIGNEAIPKSAARVLNAFKIQEDWKSKKRQLDEDVDEKPARKRKKTGEISDNKRGERGQGKASQLRIKPGESIQHFNRRVEDDMRPLVKSAMQTSYAVARDTRKAELEARAEARKKKHEQVKNIPVEWKPREPSIDKHAGRPKEFEKGTTSTPRRLNDVAQAPPELNILPRGTKNPLSSKVDILSMSQKSMMEQEREKVIIRYRQLKASRRQAGEGNGRAQDDQDRE